MITTDPLLIGYFIPTVSADELALFFNFFFFFLSNQFSNGLLLLSPMELKN